MKLPDYPSFRDWLLRERRTARLTQAELGVAAGVSATQISEVESGKNPRLSREHTIGVAKALLVDSTEPLLLSDYAPEHYFQLLAWCNSQRWGRDGWSEGVVNAVNAAWLNAKNWIRKPGDPRPAIPAGTERVGIAARFLEIREIEHKVRHRFLQGNLWDLI